MSECCGYTHWTRTRTLSHTQLNIVFYFILLIFDVIEAEWESCHNILTQTYTRCGSVARGRFSITKIHIQLVIYCRNSHKKAQQKIISLKYFNIIGHSNRIQSNMIWNMQAAFSHCAWYVRRRKTKQNSRLFAIYQQQQLNDSDLDVCTHFAALTITQETQILLQLFYILIKYSNAITFSVRYSFFHTFLHLEERLHCLINTHIQMHIHHHHHWIISDMKW